MIGTTDLFNDDSNSQYNLFDDMLDNDLNDLDDIDKQDLWESSKRVDDLYEDNDGTFLSSWDDESGYLESQILNREDKGGLFFIPKSMVSDYETNVTVEFQINTWNDLYNRFNLKWSDSKNYTLVQSIAEFKQYIRIMEQVSYLACDAETTGLSIYNLDWDNPLKDHIVGLSLCWKVGHAIYIPLRHKKFKNLPIDKVMKLLKPLLEKKKLILHNAIFDYKVFYDLGIMINVAHDTMSMLFHINTMVVKGGKALKDNISRIFGIDTIDLETMTGKSKYASKFDTLDFRTCEVYGCADVDFAMQFFLYLLPYLPERSFDGYRQDINLIKRVAVMEYEGRRVDVSKLPLFNEINDKDIATLKKLVFNYVGTSINFRNGIDKVDSYLFNMNSPDDLSIVLYDILKIPILDYSKKTGKPKTDSNIFKTLLKETTEVVDPVLDKLIKGNVKSSVFEYPQYVDENGNIQNYGEDGDELLVKYSKIADKKYPFIYLLKELRGKIKLKTSFFKKLMDSNYEGKYFTSVSLTSAETHRIIDPIQTIPAFLKEIFIPYTDDEYYLGADYAQVEAREFTNLAGDQDMIVQLNKNWADYHRESGAKIFGKRPEDIEKEERDSLKVVNFGIPFDMRPGGLVNFKYGTISDKNKRKEKIDEMTVLYEGWKVANYKVQDLLDSYRDEALKICKEPQVLEYFKGKKVSKIYSPCGRARVFSLEGVVDEDNNIIDSEKASRIRRQAGNFPIQDGARHKFGEALLNLTNEFESKGLLNIKIADERRPLGYRFVNLIHMLSLVHDEFNFSIDKRINSDYIMQKIEELCMLKYEGMATYFMGISFALNWHEAHSGSMEMPVQFVLDRIKELKETDGDIPVFKMRTKNDSWINPRDFYKPLIKQHKVKTQYQEILNRSRDKDIDIDVSEVTKSFPNYIAKADIAKTDVESGMTEYLKQYFKGLDGESLKFTIKCCSICLKFKGEINVKYKDSIVVIKRRDMEQWIA